MKVHNIFDTHQSRLHVRYFVLSSTESNLFPLLSSFPEGMMNWGAGLNAILQRIEQKTATSPGQHVSYFQFSSRKGEGTRERRDKQKSEIRAEARSKKGENAKQGKHTNSRAGKSGAFFSKTRKKS
jgi:hypothetical protein